MSTQSEALRAYVQEHGIKQKHLAEICEVNPGTMSSILSGRYTISREVALRLTGAFGFDVHFLMTGEGSLLPPPGMRFRRIDQSHNTGNIANGGDIRQISGDAALAVENAQLREQLEQARAEKDRLLGIIETLTAK